MFVDNKEFQFCFVCVCECVCNFFKWKLNFINKHCFPPSSQLQLKECVYFLRKMMFAAPPHPQAFYTLSIFRESTCCLFNKMFLNSFEDIVTL